MEYCLQPWVSWSFFIGTFFAKNTPEPVLDFGPERGSAKETYVWHETLLSSSSHNLAYVPGPTFGFVKLLGSSGSHCTKWADEQHRPAGFESRLVSDPPPLYPHFNRPSGFWPCVKPCLVGDIGKYRQLRRFHKRRVLETWGDLLSLRLQWKSIS